LPFHMIDPEGLTQIVGGLLISPTTWISLGCIALAFGLWTWRSAWLKPARALKPVLASGLGFEWINQQVAGLTRRAARLLQRAQTGQLNWNIAGILAGLVVILIILVRGA